MAKKLGFSFLAKKSTNQVYWVIAVLLSLALLGLVGFTLYFIIRTTDTVFQPDVSGAEGLVRFDIEATSQIKKLPTPSAETTLEAAPSPLPSPTPLPIPSPSPSPLQSPPLTPAESPDI